MQSRDASTDQSRSSSDSAPTIVQTSSLPKGAVVYHRVHGQSSPPPPSSLDAAVPSTLQSPVTGPGAVQRVIPGGTAAASSTAAAKSPAGNPTLMRRIVGGSIGGPVLARLVQAGQKVEGNLPTSQQQFTHVQLQGTTTKSPTDDSPLLLPP